MNKPTKSSIITSRGMSAEFAGMMTLLFQLVALPATFIMPIIADKFDNQRVSTTISSLIFLVGVQAAKRGNYTLRIKTN
ncbi:hypothetical protein [Clostridium estertheticum]|uniref:hypothetical protein n=1 Tax=Clostridium estertheticum TaxID=238834 RepID=UPI001CF25468|nr:hypothetical protein [Clostridium estertheticum]MCB2357250.1 hypothetical protein [Clostridium estertheticum]WAG43914.1 hypothetical protein LL065_25805 [Clostridium estertheticum]